MKGYREREAEVIFAVMTSRFRWLCNSKGPSGGMLHRLSKGPLVEKEFEE